MTLLYYDPAFLAHNTGAHPERAERLRRTVVRLAQAGLDDRCRRMTWDPAPLTSVARIHDPKYAAELAEFAGAGGGQIEQDTVVSTESYDVALLAAGAVCDAVRNVVQGDDKQALCLVRPPGHHALRHASMGFCLFNNVAIGAALATKELELNRVLIVDWDVHHGNGTQASFWTDPQVGFLSIHRWPFYPGTGRADETGEGRGLGATLNVPVEMGTSRAMYRSRFASALDHIAHSLRPELVIVSAGFDSHALDPVGSLGLDSEDFVGLSQEVLGVAQEYAGGKLVSVLEGGYHPDMLAECVDLHLRTLLDQPI